VNSKHKYYTKGPKRLERREFLEVLDRTQLVSIDLVIKDPKGRILLGLRTNEPAKDYWFVPGGRIMKDENLEEAFERISEEELGVKYSLAEARLLGPFSHQYETNSYLEPGISTQYIVLAYELHQNDDKIPNNKIQHSEYKWIAVEDLDSPESLIAGKIHQNTLVYLRMQSELARKNIEF
jgi:colanic acid biosynthesis protein WcaH